MIKQTHIFFLLLKIDENNSYLFFKNYFVFYFILKKFLENVILENFKIKNCF